LSCTVTGQARWPAPPRGYAVSGVDIVVRLKQRK